MKPHGDIVILTSVQTASHANSVHFTLQTGGTQLLATNRKGSKWTGILYSWSFFVYFVRKVS